MSTDGKPRNTDQKVSADFYDAPYWKELERRKRALIKAEKARARADKGAK